jgi:16S rRNA (cytidine1402-2'-O)-methyltransferase
VVHPKAMQDVASSIADDTVTTTATALLTRLLQELPLKTAVQVAMDVSGLPKNSLYDQALKLKDAS